MKQQQRQQPSSVTPPVPHGDGGSKSLTQVPDVPSRRSSSRRGRSFLFSRPSKRGATHQPQPQRHQQKEQLLKVTSARGSGRASMAGSTGGAVAAAAASSITAATEDPPIAPALVHESTEDHADPLNIRHLMTDNHCHGSSNSGSSMNNNEHSSSDGNNNVHTGNMPCEKSSQPLASPLPMKAPPVRQTARSSLSARPPASLASSCRDNSNGKETAQQRLMGSTIRRREQRRREIYAWNEELRLKHQNNSAADAV
ncbi:hypothetical protein DQ04_12581000 [Trypanosoma grayi]|uniref:hypothetical protein n=1 Tax=Trypanosoma grayi TaxID=71804 RepID=UPI0004F419CD|nr:hypothetical protein DQ04_12581000 [Trypanosoma grayi]KEG06718.1 hypothetical protein DQ04_12581000 [Trypanosoma grayi]